MAEPFKNLINAQAIATAAEHLTKAWPPFPSAKFENDATRGLLALEMKARAMQIASALEAHLPQDFAKACAVIEASLAAPLPLSEEGEPVGLGTMERAAGISGWIIWSLGEFVVRRGMHDVPRALGCLHALTQRFSAEFAIRPFIEKHPTESFKLLRRWVTDPSAHVRRLVSEGSRTRLPWGIRLHALIVDPSPTLALVAKLQDDQSAYVRRSVANHLNDVAKDHPDRIAQWVKEHLRDASPARIALLRHASRSLVKQGHADTLKAWGVGTQLKGSATLSLAPKRAHIGDTVALHVTLASSAKEAQSLVVDYAVLYVTAKGKASVKVRKGWKLQLSPRETRTLTKQLSLKVVSTRRLYPGVHRVELLVNGKPMAQSSFELRARA
jgi:3-methyladenine DNA glycosylase AlkC